MNTIFIVLPILTLLMFGLGLTLKPADFKLCSARKRQKRSIMCSNASPCLLAYVGITKLQK